MVLVEVSASSVIFANLPEMVRKVIYCTMSESEFAVIVMTYGLFGKHGKVTHCRKFLFQLILVQGDDHTGCLHESHTCILCNFKDTIHF